MPRYGALVPGGLSTAADLDDVGDDGIDDTVHAAYVDNVGNQEPGKVLTVTCDCVPGVLKPAADAFACTVLSAADADANSIDEHCMLAVQ